MIRKATISGVIFALVACARLAHGQSPSLELQISIARAKSSPAGEATRPLPVTKTPPAFDADSLPADAQPTPMEGVTAGLAALDLKPTDTFADIGCGFDCRWGITAAKKYGCKVVAIERDPEIAASAMRYIEHAGLSDRILLVVGDVSEVQFKANKAAAYMWPEFLSDFRPRIEKFDRFVSYGFDVPGLKTESRGDHYKFYVWNRPAPVAAVTRVPITRTQRQTVRLPRGSYCQVCGRNCSNPMAHKNVTTIVGYQNKLAAVPRSATTPLALQGESAPRSQRGVGRWVTQKVCVNGRCSMQRVWQAY